MVQLVAKGRGGRRAAWASLLTGAFSRIGIRINERAGSPTARPCR
jgi:hypothetical protein